MKRLFFFLALGCASLAYAQLTPLKGSATKAEEPVGEPTQEMIDEECTRVAKKCGFSVGYTLHREMSGNVLAPEEVKKYLPQFFAAMDIFPVRFLRETQLHTLVLCRNLTTSNGGRAGGVAGGGKICLGVPFYSQVIYHEMFHIADNLGHNEDWTKLNHRQFVYGGSALKPVELDKKTQIKADAAKSSADIRKDFVSDYAMTSEVEDRAETFAVMVANPKRFAALAKESPVLEKKALAVKKIVREFAPSMNKDFWTFIADSDDASRTEDFAKRAKINDQRKKDKKPLLNSGYTK